MKPENFNVWDNVSTFIYLLTTFLSTDIFIYDLHTKLRIISRTVSGTQIMLLGVFGAVDEPIPSYVRVRV